MSSFIIQKDGFTSYTCVSNCFIERYMPKAPGEFVKIYIYLLKCIEEQKTELSISKIADAFEDTQKDVIRALKYWEKRGLLKLSFNENILTSLKLVSLSDVSEDSETVVRQPEKVVVNITGSSSKPPAQKKQYAPDEMDDLLKNNDLNQLIYVAQAYLGRTLNSVDLNTILFIYDELKLPVDVIDYLFEYCVSKKKKDMRYIEKTAINWAEKGINSVHAAKSLNNIFNENARPVMRAFGLSGRSPVRKELEYIEKWTLSYGFSADIIELACTRTINTIHQPSFEYADRILENWHKNKVASLKDIEALDQKHNNKKVKKTSQNASSVIDYPQHNYDYAEIAKALLNK